MSCTGRPATLDVLNGAVKELIGGQTQLRETARQKADEMLPQAGMVRKGLGMLANTEMVRAIRILESVSTQTSAQAKRNALSDARLTGERITRSLQEMEEQFRKFRQDWEMTDATAVRADAGRSADQTASALETGLHRGRFRGVGAAQAERAILELVKLIGPVFSELSQRLQPVDVLLAGEYQKAAATLNGARCKRC